jgi:hypothetical protein
MILVLYEEQQFVFIEQFIYMLHEHKALLFLRKIIVQLTFLSIHFYIYFVHLRCTSVSSFIAV